MSELWKKRLLRASFNGIPFFLESHEMSAGRYSKEHEPPDRNSGFSEDIGKKTPSFKIEAHVLGDNYFFNRDALKNALESQSVGLLVHPYLGIMTVQPKGFSLRESTKEGRIAFFGMEFVEKGNPFFPFAVIDSIVDFVTEVVSYVLIVQTAFESTYQIAGLPAFTLESAEAMLSDLATSFSDVFANVRTEADKHADMAKEAQELEDNKAVLVRGDPADIISAIDSLLDGLKDLVPDAPDNSTIDSTSGRDDQLAVFSTFLEFRGVADSIIGTTPTRIQERINAEAIAQSVVRLAIARLSEQVVNKQFKSNEEAEQARALISDAIESQLTLEVIDDDTFQSLEDINAKLAAAVPNTRSQFSNSKTIELLDFIPTLVLAYDLYQGVEADTILDNERDIIDRNKIRKPQFAVGKLEVLTGTGG